MTTTTRRPGAWGLRRRVRVSGGEVATDVFGEGPPVVLVHGTPAWSFLWREVAPLLARTHTVHVWDLLGFGDSTLRTGVRPSIAEQARTLAELIDHWGLEEAPSLVGHDIGGGIVARAHLTGGVRAGRLAFLDAAVLGPWNTPFTEHMQRHADVYRTMPTEVFHELIAGRLRTATHRPMSDAIARAYLAPWAGNDGQSRWIDQVSSVSFEDARHAAARLEQIAVPTLVLWGEQDGWLRPEVADRLAAAVPGAQQAWVEGAGHFIAEDDPQATADALLEFLATTAASTTPATPAP